MAETAYWLSLLAILLIGSIVGLRLGATSAGLARPAWFQAALAVMATAGIAAALAFAAAYSARLAGGPWYIAPAATLIALPIIGYLVLRFVLRGSRSQSLKALLVVGLSSAVILGFELLTIRLVVQGFSIPTNAMAPTLKGRHFIAQCSECGGNVIVPADFDDMARKDAPRESGICEACFAVTEHLEIISEVRSGDRILVNSLAEPARWDLIVFRYPGDPNVTYVKRLVALPGESIEVRDGQIVIDGNPIDPPPEIAGLRWSQPRDVGQTQYGAAGQPLKLSEDECFALGDFSEMSYDSRYWGPLKTSEVTGVVQSVYFPPRSWKTFPRH
jgi:signal peptidase I